MAPEKRTLGVNLHQAGKLTTENTASKIRIVGEHIAAARKLLKITQAELAAVAEVSEATIKKFEIGLHTPRPSTLKAIRQAMEYRGIEFTNGDSPGVRYNPAKASIPRGS